MDRKSIKTGLELLEKGLLAATFFLYPLLFSTLFPNAFATTKLVLLAVIFIALLLVKAAKIVNDRKLELYASPFNSPLFLFGVAYLVSVVVSSPNKIEALLDPSRGAVMVILLVMLQFLMPSNKAVALYSSLAALFVLLLTGIGSYFGMFKFLPASMSYINNKTFTPLGSTLDLALFAGYFVALALEALQRSKGAQDKVQKLLTNVTFVIALPVLVLSLFALFKDIKPVFLPFSISWQVAMEGLKDAKGALFGVGPANYLALFTIAKPFAYNTLQSLWSLNIEFSHSTLLQILSEVGVLGVAGLSFVFVHLVSHARKAKAWLSIGVLLFWTFFLPMSPTYFFLLFLAVYMVRETRKVRELDFHEVELVGYGLATVFVIVAGTASFFLFQAFAAEYLLSASSIAASNNQAQAVYDMQRQATVFNPYNERVRLTFSQTNMLLAQNIAQKKDLKDSDKQTVTTLIQQGINEAKALVALNPQKAIYWANLAEVYRVVLPLAQQADVWTVSSYQRAIALDKNNPTYYFNLGSVYYGLKNYTEAAKFFEQATSLKPDIANYHYNLAWDYFQLKQYPQAVNAMQNALQYIKPKTEDYTKAQKDLEQFKALLPKEEKTTDNGQQTTTEQTLTQPSPIPSISGEPIKLPTNSAPPAVPSVTATPNK